MHHEVLITAWQHVKNATPNRIGNKFIISPLSSYSRNLISMVLYVRNVVYVQRNGV